MTRIRTIALADADEPLRIAREAQHALYPPEYAMPVPPFVDEAAGIVASHSLIPEALHHAFATFGALMAPDLPLDRRQHEMIATVVSATNRTYYCTTSHTEFLNRVIGDDGVADAVSRDFRSCADQRRRPGHARVRGADHARCHSASPTSTTLRLRDAGFDDTGILQITLIAAWFNYINRVADALGVGTT